MKAGSVLGYTYEQALDEPIGLLDAKINDRVEIINSVLRVLMRVPPEPKVSDQPMTTQILMALVGRRQAG